MMLEQEDLLVQAQESLIVTRTFYRKSNKIDQGLIFFGQ